MLNHSTRISAKSSLPQRQDGVVLIIALIVLVAMTLAAIALTRSSDTNTVIAGNLAFQQSATHSGDTGVETAIAWLNANKAGTTLDNDDATNGYAANGSNPAQSPAVGQSWNDYWVQTLSARPPYTLPIDSAGNTVSYVIDRLCNNAGAKTGGAACIASPVVTAATGNAEEAGEKQLNAPSVVYYRITVRVAGPRNTVSYVQAVVSM
ncbi:MAG: Type fimbrial biosis protein PilX [Pseudomonadota bacterium]|jgi:Tfp pilus assembly protein PilX